VPGFLLSFPSLLLEWESTFFSERQLAYLPGHDAPAFVQISGLTLQEGWTIEKNPIIDGI
jgi:hypothetical protein